MYYVLVSWIAATPSAVVAALIWAFRAIPPCCTLAERCTPAVKNAATSAADDRLTSVPLMAAIWNGYVNPAEASIIPIQFCAEAGSRPNVYGVVVPVGV